jgi:chemotaxis protein histidine kinase CheA
MKAIGLYSGATVLGDGTVALILDVQALARRALRTETTDRQDSRRPRPPLPPTTPSASACCWPPSAAAGAWRSRSTP